MGCGGAADLFFFVRGDAAVADIVRTAAPQEGRSAATAAAARRDTVTAVVEHGGLVLALCCKYGLGVLVFVTSKIVASFLFYFWTMIV